MSINKTTFNYFILFIAVLVTTTSCKKFLDVKPKDRILEVTIFSNEASVNTALNGIYLSMAKPNLYGGNLTMSTIDILGQYYNCTGTHVKAQFAGYKYTDAGVMATMDQIWSASYKNILNVNNFIQSLEASAVLQADKKNILLGEAYGLRAFLHFDLLRLYGPVYKTDSLAKAIPYVTSTSVNEQPVLPANQDMTLILLDLSKAAALLQGDPIRTKGVEVLTGVSSVDFYKLRNRRMNYYAVKALSARAKLYRGDLTGAGNDAREVITAAATFFPWVVPTAIESEPVNPDRVLSSEIIFGVQNSEMYNQQRDLFAATLQPTSILAPVTAQLNAIFESNERDYRFNPSWKVPAVGGKNYRTFFKFDDIQNTRLLFRMFQPLIRMSEMHYIAAETSTNTDQAIGYLNNVRHARGLTDLATTANLAQEIQKEYRKEFCGEGQMFFFYKRKSLTAIPNGAANGNLNMNLKNYVVPLPLSETQNR
ncbi:RagB/SusD family nutrient uptake outer membrane protein [Pedobacter nyackensis]|uniref:RagB/SusD family nutrient uptake outer membrane protein n=1 Tax=Pedobacter nyackensis TaxID=475255 RepID=UPI0029317840|nr:RagB/SusD family nutrient uptake outer membrane protein [Pedobacter nyackensis]